MSYTAVLLTDMTPNALWSRPVGAYRLATELRRHGFSAKVVFGLGDYPPDQQWELLSNLVDCQTRVLGLATTFMSHDTRFAGPRGWRSVHSDAVSETLLKLRAKFPNLKLIAGGANAHRWPTSLIDLYVTGFGDEVLVQFLNGKLSPSQVQTIEGRSILSVPTGHSVGDFQTLYDPSDCLDANETLTLEISRGCRFRCKFCAYPLNGRKKNDYLKPSVSLRDELLRNFELFGISKYILGDDTFNESTEKIDHVLAVFENLPFKISWATYMRLDLLAQQRSSWERLANAGLRGVFFGIESLHDPSARAIGKGLGYQRTLSTLKGLRETWGDAVATQAGFIVGLPFETERTFAAWSHDLLHPNFPLHVKTFQPLWIEANNPFYPWRSEFQSNSKEFGYCLSGSGADSRWVNREWDSTRANELANATNLRAYEQGVQRSFGPFFNLMIMGYGLTYEQAFALNPSEKGYALLEPHTRRRVSEYRLRELRFAELSSASERSLTKI